MPHQQPDIFTWQSHPAKERPQKAALGVAIMLALAAVVLLAFGPFWAAGALLVLFLSLNRFYMPSRFTIDHQGITAQYPLRKMKRRWVDLRRFVHDEHGGFLSTRGRPSRLDAYSGMHLMFGERRDEVIERVRAMMEKAEGRSQRSEVRDQQSEVRDKRSDEVVPDIQPLTSAGRGVSR